MAEAFGGAIEDVRTLIIGAGMGGIGVALELTRRGEDDFIVIDRGPKAGGVWR
ncbi:NAD(P)-binding protein, partial [Streptococcus suis]